MGRPSVVIVGASLAGLAAARTLRADGYDGELLVVDADPDHPYDKPPLSKQMLSDDWDPSRIALASASDEALALDLRTGTRAVSLDLERRVIGLQPIAGGAVEEHPFDGVVLACGASARRLPGTEHIAGVHVVRSLRDSLELRDALEAGPSAVAVIGAGFIGAEVASSCRSRDLPVTLIEALPVPLERILGSEIGQVCAQVHREHQVDLRCGVGVDHLLTHDVDGVERVRGVRLTDGSEVAAEVVVVGIGVSVNTSWLETSGLTLDDGVLCDDTLLAAPGVVACGDLARYPSARMGRSVRIEHWEHAIAGGEAAGRRLAAWMRDEPGVAFDAVPWFWSDQYDRKIQLAGRPDPGDEMRIVHGSTEEFRFVALYGRAGRLTAVLGMNRPRHVVQLRGLLEEEISFDEAIAIAEAL